jgi:hypothetical protein
MTNQGQVRPRSCARCLLLILVVMTGCTNTSKQEQPRVISSDEATQIAIKDAREKGWKNFQASKAYLRNKDTWSVLLTRLPVVPGNHAYVIISAKTGEILEWKPGL